MKNLWLSKKKQLNFSRSMQNYFAWLNTTRGDIQPLGIVMATREIMLIGKLSKYTQSIKNDSSSEMNKELNKHETLEEHG